MPTEKNPNSLRGLDTSTSKWEKFKQNARDAVAKVLVPAAMLTGLSSHSTAMASVSNKTNSQLVTVVDADTVEDADVMDYILGSKNSDISTINKARNYAPMQIHFLSATDILPIVGQIEVEDKKAYQHIEHLGIAEGTKIRDMMRKYGAGPHSPDEYKNLMSRLYTGMTGEVPIGYNNYETIGEGGIESELSEHAHDERDILNSIVDKTNFIVQNKGSPRRKPIYELTNANPNNIYIFGNSIYGISTKERRLSGSENLKKNLAGKNNFLIFAASTNIGKLKENGERITKNKIYHESVNSDENGCYSLPSGANGAKNKNPDNHIMVTVGTNKNGDFSAKYDGSKFPVGFHDQSLFAGRPFPYRDNDYGGRVVGKSGNYASSYPNYVNVAMASLCFQMGADVEDVDELLDRMRATALTDYVRLDLNGDGDTEDVVRVDTDDGYIDQPESQPLLLINPAGYFREYCLPSDLPTQIKTNEAISLDKGYYKGVIFNIPGAEVLIDGERVAFGNENSTLIKSQNPFTLERRLNGELSKQLGCEGSIEGSIQAVDDERNGLNHLNKTITLTLKGDVSGIDGIESDRAAGKWYSIDGKKLSSTPSAPGIYIHDGKKVVGR